MQQWHATGVRDNCTNNSAHTKSALPPVVSCACALRGEAARAREKGEDEEEEQEEEEEEEDDDDDDGEECRTWTPVA